jgi:capsid assembly protease
VEFVLSAFKSGASMSNRRQRRFAERLYNRPLLLSPEAAHAITAAEALATVDAVAFRGRPKSARLNDGSRAEIYRLEDGIAIIPVMGELVNRAAAVEFSLTSYEWLGEQLRASVADPNIRGILLDMDSPGGEASGAVEAGAAVRQVAGQKPVVAFVNGLAASAAYAIASGASRIITLPSGVLGSIGVVLLHIDRSEALAQAGLKPTLIQAGAFKTDYSGLRALPPDAKTRIQSSVDEMHGLFVRTVARHRGLSEAAVRATEGGMFMGRAAVSAGLADGVGTFDDAMRFLRGKPSHDAPAAASAIDPGLLRAHRERAGAICLSDEAKGREMFAQHLALETDLRADAARALWPRAPADAATESREPARRKAAVVTGLVMAPRGLAFWRLRVRAKGI